MMKPYYFHFPLQVYVERNLVALESTIVFAKDIVQKMDVFGFSTSEQGTRRTTQHSTPALSYQQKQMRCVPHPATTPPN
jgi:hypothetical protein